VRGFVSDVSPSPCPLPSREREEIVKERTGEAMENLMEIIKKRVSVRAYKDKPLPKKVVKDILEAARYAPTARNLQELEYKVITSKAMITKLSEGVDKVIRKEGFPVKGPPGGRPGVFHDAPLLIIITAPKENRFSDSDAALAVQNIMLYATSIDLGSCFIGMAKLIERDKNLLKELHIADDRNIAAAVICGYADEKPEPKEKKLNAEFFE
jgi:nitroreductase